MPRLPQIKPEKLIRIILKKGFISIRQSGSHIVFKHPDGRWTTIPNHRKVVGKGLLGKILKDAEIDAKDL